MRFLHAADLHLDTAPSGLRSYPPVVAEALRDASLHALDRLVDVAIQLGVGCVVLAGDIYEGAQRGTRAQLRFRDALERLDAAGVRTFVAHGNHDPVEEGWSAIRSWPAGVTVFSPGEPETVVLMDGDHPIAVQGVSYGRRAERRNLARSFLPVPQEAFGIGVLHTDVGALGGDHAPCTLADLEEVGARCGIGYWALGHVHTRRVLRGPDPWVVYPGNTQGRHPSASELGAKGAVVVEVRDGRASEPEFVPLDAVRFVEVTVDVADMADIGDAHDALRERGDDLRREHDGRPLVVRATLCGRGPLHSVLRRDGVEALHQELAVVDREPFVWWDRIEDRTLPQLDLAAAREADDLVGNVLRHLDGFDADAVSEVLARLPEPARAALSAAGAPADASEWSSAAAVTAVDALIGDGSWS